MKKELGFKDSDGNISKDENRFIQEYADFLKNNPEKLERLNELKRRNKKYEDFIELIERMLTIDERNYQSVENELNDFCDKYFTNDSEMKEYCKKYYIPFDEDEEIE